MSALLDVTVPCPSCENEIGYGVSKCAKCGTPIPPDLRSTLDERLASASPEFALLREHQRTASWTLLFIALVLWAEGVIVFAADRFGSGYVPSDSTALLSALTTLVIDGLLGVVFVGAHLAARNAPVAGTAVGAAAWVGVNAAISVQYVSMLSLYWVAIRVVLLLLLVRGVVSAVRANALRRRLVQPA